MSELRQRTFHGNSKVTPEQAPLLSTEDSFEKRKKPRAITSVDKKAILAVLVLTLFAFISRFWAINHPDQVVFDEVHFGKFGSYYLRQTYYFDVHPPLGKLMFGGMGWLVGYDGHYLFDKIGEDYISRNVPYVALRSLPAFFGAILVPVVFGILYETNHSIATSFLGASMIILDTALLTHQRLILLDSFLIFFDIFSVYAWIKFYRQRFTPFSISWWFWLNLTGVSIAMATGVKMVGLFVVGLVGFATLHDLWRIIDYKRGLALPEVLKHFFARVFGLIVVPLTVYLAFFAIHFAVLTKTGPGDTFMSPSFQATLEGNRMNKESHVVYYGANITIMHFKTSVFLHSHPHNYPLRYDDDRVSSQGQQVTGYPYEDANNIWKLLPHEGDITNVEDGKPVARPLKHDDVVRLMHASTGKYLLTHDVASPLTPTHQEVTCISDDKPERYNETLFRVVIDNGKEGAKVASIDTKFRLEHIPTRVSIHSHKGKYDEWGFGQQEVNGNKSPKDKANQWIVQSIEGEFEPEKARGKYDAGRPGFLRKFFELQGTMLAHNARLTGSHPFQSSPWTWPVLSRGISFWVNDKDAQIYLIGNPITWWLSLAAIVCLLIVGALDAVAARRGIAEISPHLKRRLFMTGAFFFAGWLLHYLPFFLMGRSLFLHHYLPAAIYSMLVFCHVYELLFQALPNTSRALVTLVLLTIFAYGFYSFMPFSYGFSQLPETVDSRKWLDGWDLSYGVK